MPSVWLTRWLWVFLVSELLSRSRDTMLLRNQQPDIRIYKRLPSNSNDSFHFSVKKRRELTCRFIDSASVKSICIAGQHDLWKLLNAEARLPFQASSCGIYGGQSGTGTGCCPNTSVFPCRYHHISALHTQFLHHRLYVILAIDSFFKWHPPPLLSLT